MTTHLSKPYKIVAFLHKRYSEHYNIPSSEVVVIPKKKMGDEVLCDVCWIDERGIAHAKNDFMFSNENLAPLDRHFDEKLLAVWMHCNGEMKMTNEQMKTKVVHELYN